MKDDTIISLSTPQGLGAVGIVRLSGESSLKIASSIIKPFAISNFASAKPRYMYLGECDANGIKDKCLAVYFNAPHSFTGEDIVEFQCHGGQIILQGLIKKAISLGARLATNGEFSKRAFLNGKMDLANVEGMADLINAESTASSKLAFSLFSGGISDKARALQEELENSIAYIEASFDYPEEDVPPINVPEVTSAVISQISTLEKLLSTYQKGRAISEGVNVAILGKPNVGKSSLLNAILGMERAIVTDIAGTTRDVLSAKYEYEGTLFQLYDTAGIRASSDIIEKIGIEKARTIIENADLLLATFDSSRPLDEEDLEILHSIKGKPALIVINKTDKAGCECSFIDVIQSEIVKAKNPSRPDFVSISAKTGEGIENLKAELFKLTGISNLLSTESLVITNERHYSALASAKSMLEKLITEIDALPADCAILDIRKAWTLYGEITGDTASEHIIDTIFSKLCLGK